MPICSIVKKSAVFALVFGVSVFAYQNVLVLNSYNQGFVKTNDITRAIQDVLRKSNINIHIEDMDMHEELINSMLQKYIDINMKFDVIITVDQTAFNYVKNHESILWENVPIVACGISRQLAELVSEPAATEYIEPLDSENTEVSLEQIDSAATKKIVMVWHL